MEVSLKKSTTRHGNSQLCLRLDTKVHSGKSESCIRFEGISVHSEARPTSYGRWCGNAQGVETLESDSRDKMGGFFGIRSGGFARKISGFQALFTKKFQFSRFFCIGLG